MRWLKGTKRWSDNSSYLVTSVNDEPFSLSHVYLFCLFMLIQFLHGTMAQEVRDLFLIKSDLVYVQYSRLIYDERRSSALFLLLLFFFHSSSPPWKRFTRNLKFNITSTTTMMMMCLVEQWPSMKASEWWYELALFWHTLNSYDADFFKTQSKPNLMKSWHEASSLRSWIINSEITVC